MNSNPDSDAELHVLVCARDVNMCIVAIKTFLRYVSDVKVVIHDDGSLSGSDFKSMTRNIVGATVISRAQADLAIEGSLSREMWTKREQHVLLMKVFDFNFFNNAKKTILLDSDIVFCARPDEVIGWLREPNGQSFYNADPLVDTFRAVNYLDREKLPRHFNSGFMGYEGRMTMQEIEDAIRQIGYWLEDQTVYAYLLAHRSAHPLPAVRYQIYEGGEYSPASAMVHFISPDRFTGMTYVNLARPLPRSARSSGPLKANIAPCCWTQSTSAPRREPHRPPVPLCGILRGGFRRRGPAVLARQRVLTHHFGIHSDADSTWVV